jgi:hypothetical protein
MPKASPRRAYIYNVAVHRAAFNSRAQDEGRARREAQGGATQTGKPKTSHADEGGEGEARRSTEAEATRAPTDEATPLK